MSYFIIVFSVVCHLIVRFIVQITSLGEKRSDFSAIFTCHLFLFRGVSSISECLG